MSKIIQVILLISIFTSSNFSAIAQTDYTIQLKEPLKKIKPNVYFIKDVHDRRTDISANGKILTQTGKPVPVLFNNSLDSNLSAYLSLKIPSDTGLIPLELSIEKLSYTDIGIPGRHTLTLNVKLSIFRTIEGKEFVLYETKGSPNYTSQGITGGLAEKLLQDVLDQLFEGLEKWINENPDQQTLCKKTKAVFIYDDSYTDYTNSDTIRWKSDYKLKWPDFQGKPHPSSSFSAQSNCMFSFKSFAEYDSGVMRINLIIYSCFTKKASWVVEENKQESLLRHEQLHFDICELYIRRLKKAVENTELTLLNPSDQVREKFDQAWNDYQIAQALYDNETQHGLIEQAQKSWEAKIQNEIVELAAFASP